MACAKQRLRQQVRMRFGNLPHPTGFAQKVGNASAKGAQY
jgi:hypothetical protein